MWEGGVALETGVCGNSEMNCTSERYGHDYHSVGLRHAASRVIVACGRYREGCLPFTARPALPPAAPGRLDEPPAAQPGQAHAGAGGLGRQGRAGRGWRGHGWVQGLGWAVGVASWEVPACHPGETVVLLAVVSFSMNADVYYLS